MKLAERITELRLKKGISSEKLAYNIGVSKTTVRRIERHIYDPHFRTLVLIADGLDVSIAELLNFIPYPAQGTWYEDKSDM